VNAQGAILALLAERGTGGTSCPSEAARMIAGETGDWRAHMPAVHQAVDELVSSGRIALSWKGQALPGRRGPYRIGQAGERP
jgi:hypothetical protein